VTPEYGNFSKVGGIAVMVKDLCEVLVQMGERVVVISPYYNQDRAGKTGYLEAQGVKFQNKVISI
jgi:glycogen synthase